jgi:hypothetical protein
MPGSQQYEVPDSFGRRDLNRAGTGPWELLHHQIPRLFQHATFDYTGGFWPGIRIRAEIKRELVDVHLRFGVMHKGYIEYRLPVPNMGNREDIHTHVFTRDLRLLPTNAIKNRKRAHTNRTTGSNFF